MAETNFRGPISAMGSLEVNAATAAVEPYDGPSMFYQGVAVPDIRSAPFAKDNARPGQQPAFMIGAGMVIIDQIPAARTSTQIAAAQIVTTSVAVALVTSQPAGVASAAGIAVGVPIVPLGTTVATFANLALDFGFATGTTAANSSTVVVVDSSVFRTNAWIVIGGAANSSASRSLITQIISSPNATTIQISPVAATTLNNVPIGQANLWGSTLLPNATQFGPSAVSPTGHAFGGAMSAGLARIYNPRETLSRNLSITSVTAIAVAYSAVISGWDVWGTPMTEVVSAITAQTTFVSKKAFKYISSITSGTTVPASQAVAFGLGDTIGLPIRADYWEELLDVSWNGATMTNFNGFVAAVTSPATSTTGDVRGSVQLSTAILTGASATAISAVPSNGTGRLYIQITPTPSQMIIGTPLNTAPLFGVAQSTATT